MENKKYIIRYTAEPRWGKPTFTGSFQVDDEKEVEAEIRKLLKRKDIDYCNFRMYDRETNQFIKWIEMDSGTKI